MPKALYRIPATCLVCRKKFKARYNVGRRAKVCTKPSHKCRKGKKLGVKVSCRKGCCRSKYFRTIGAYGVSAKEDRRCILSSGEFSRMWKLSQSLPNPAGIALRFMARTGCRQEEARVVLPGDLKWSGGLTSVVLIGGRSVHLSNGDAFTRELRKWEMGAPGGKPLFPVARRTLQRSLEKILDVVKPDRLGLTYILRRTRASQIMRAGGDWNYLQSQLGFSAREPQDRYIHASRPKASDVLGRIK